MLYPTAELDSFLRAQSIPNAVRGDDEPAPSSWKLTLKMNTTQHSIEILLIKEPSDLTTTCLSTFKCVVRSVKHSERKLRPFVQYDVNFVWLCFMLHRVQEISFHYSWPWTLMCRLRTVHYMYLSTHRGTHTIPYLLFETHLLVYFIFPGMRLWWYEGKNGHSLLSKPPDFWTNFIHCWF